MFFNQLKKCVFAFGLVSGLSLASSASAGVITLEQVIAPTQVAAPFEVSAPSGNTSQIFIADRRSGEIQIYDTVTNTFLADPFLTVPNLGQINQQGLLGFAFAPGYDTPGSAGEGLVYVSYIDVNDVHRVTEFSVDPNNPNQVIGPGRDIISIPHPDDGVQGHYGGWIGFSPNDGYLYLTTGDSESGAFSNTAQDRTDLLGGVIRIDPFGDDFANDDTRNYAIPTDNPYVGQGPGEEVFSTGLRNPYQAEFDPVSGQLLISDVGENRFEEINVAENGANFGWSGYEGSEEFDISALTGDVSNLQFPLYDYDHGTGDFEGRSIAGGEFYEGDIAALQGLYIFGDFTRDDVLWSFEYDADTDSISNLTQWSLELAGGSDALARIISIGTDGNGNIYLTTLFNGIFLITDATASEVPLPAAFWFMGAGLLAMRQKLRVKR